jgi:hypothetical protein
MKKFLIIMTIAALLTGGYFLNKFLAGVKKDFRASYYGRKAKITEKTFSRQKKTQKKEAKKESKHIEKDKKLEKKK